MKNGVESGEMRILKNIFDAQDGFEMKYLLLESQTEYTGQNVYSIFLSVYDSGTGNYEEKTIYDVTRNRDNAEKIFSLVSRGLVTPMTACDVISDLLTELDILE